MKAIFVGGPLDRKYKDIPDARPKYFVAVPPEFGLPVSESMQIEPCWKQVTYNKTAYTGDTPIYVAEEENGK